MSMRRTAGVQDHEAGPRVKRIFRRIARRVGHISPFARLHAHDPTLLELMAGMNKHAAAAATVPAKLKELVQLKVAAMIGCPF